MKKLMFVFVAGLAFGLVGCDGDAEQAKTPAGAKVQSGDDHSGHNHGDTETKQVEAETCPVTGEELGSMGDAIKVSYKGKEVKLCCEGCVKKFNADPEKYLSKK